MDDRIETARRWFAEELRHTAQVRSPAVVEAFATVKREQFCGPGPWHLLSPMRMAGYWTTESADPTHLYHDVLVAIDETRRLNNGQPSLWACFFDQLGLARGADVVHIGTGAGYYTAILAEIVGPTGRITGVEIDPHLAERSRQNLASDWPQAAVVTADGFAYRPERPADVIIVNAGVSHLSLSWIDGLAPDNGRLLVPLTAADGFGAFLIITRANLAVLFFSWLSGDQFLVWGWRISFLLSIVMVAVGLWIRLGITETPVFQKVLDEERVERVPVLEVLKRQPKQPECSTAPADVLRPIHALFQAWERLDVDEYLAQWGPNAIARSKYYVRKIADLGPRRRTDFAQYRAVDVVAMNPNITFSDKTKANVKNVYTMRYTRKDGKVIYENNVGESYVLECSARDRKWLIRENNDYLSTD